MVPVGLGFRAQRGGCVVVGVAVDRGEPRVVLSSFLATANDEDPVAFGPYHVAAGLDRGASKHVPGDPAAVIAEGRRRQDRMAAEGLGQIIRKLNECDHAPAAAALLVNRAGWMIHDLNHCISGPEHARVAEGLAVREALRFALDRCGIQIAEVDEKTLPQLASDELRKSPADIAARLDALGVTVGRPWRKEQKLACLSAWVKVAAVG